MKTVISDLRKKLYAVHIPIANQEKCAQTYGSDSPDWIVTPKMIFVGGEENAGICKILLSQ